MQPLDLWRCRPPGRHHLGRALDADDRRLWPSLLDQSGDVAGASPEVGGASNRDIRHAHQQVDRRSQPVSGKFQILLRIPYHCRDLVLIFFFIFSLRRLYSCNRPGAARADSTEHDIWQRNEISSIRNGWEHKEGLRTWTSSSSPGLQSSAEPAPGLAG